MAHALLQWIPKATNKHLEYVVLGDMIYGFSVPFAQL